MSEKLIIFIDAQDINHPSWVWLNEQLDVVQMNEKGDAALLSTLASNKEITVIIPAQEVLLTSAQLPKMNKSKLMQALPFALEDQLISDVSTLHFAVSDVIDQNNQDNYSLFVAVIANEKMKSWCALLKSWNVQANNIIPLTFTLAFTENTWHGLSLSDDTVVMRTGCFQGFVADQHNINDMMQVALAHTDLPPQLLCIQHAYLEKLNIDSMVPIQEEAYSIAQLAKNALTLPNINLLQGIFKNKKSLFTQTYKIQQATIGLFVIWLSLLLMYPTVSYFILHQRVEDLHNQIKKIYMAHFPQASSMVAPKIRMEDKLKKVTSQMSDNRFFALLNDLGEVMRQQGGITIKRLDFQNDQLTLELAATSSENFARFIELLAQQGLELKQQNANVVGEKMNAVLILR